MTMHDSVYLHGLEIAPMEATTRRWYTHDNHVVRVRNNIGGKDVVCYGRYTNCHASRMAGT